MRNRSSGIKIKVFVATVLTTSLLALILAFPVLESNGDNELGQRSVGVAVEGYSANDPTEIKVDIRKMKSDVEIEDVKLVFDENKTYQTECETSIVTRCTANLDQSIREHDVDLMIETDAGSEVWDLSPISS